MKKVCLALAIVMFGATPSPALLDAIHAFRDGAASPPVQALSAPERDALMFWIDAHGRGPLHALGVTDAQIGIPYYPIDYTLTSAPWPSTVPALAEPQPAPMPTNTPRPAPKHSNGLGAFGNLLGAALPPLQIPVASSSSSSSSSTTTNVPGGTETNSTYSNSSTSVSVGVNPWAVVSSLIDASSANAAPQPPSVPWRSLLFAASTLGDGGSGIAVTRGFAAVRNDGTEGLACISFANHSAKPVNEIDVDIVMLDALGFIHRVEPLRLVGAFAPGAEIGGPNSVEDVNAARANCVIDGERRLDDPTDPFSGASAVVYAVRRVQFADGTTWLQPGANAWT
jgi:hypothetical protein